MAVRIDATTDELTRTTTIPGITAFTMMGWFYITTDQNDFTSFLSIGETAGSDSYTVVTAVNGTTLEAYNGSTTVAGTALSVATWYHIAMTVSGTGAGQFLTYVNGVLDITHAGNAVIPAEKIWLGNDDANEFLNGRMAALKIYSAVLSAAEIANEMQCYLPIRTANLNSWYPCLSTDDDEIDFSGAGLTATVGGTLVTEDGPPIPWRVGNSRVFIPSAVTPFTGEVFAWAPVIRAGKAVTYKTVTSGFSPPSDPD